MIDSVRERRTIVPVLTKVGRSSTHRPEVVRFPGRDRSCSGIRVRYNRPSSAKGERPPRGVAFRPAKGSSMEKWMCLGTIAVSGILLAAFAMDLFLKIPFGGLSTVVDILSIVGAAIIAFLGWDSYREQR